MTRPTGELPRVPCNKMDAVGQLAGGIAHDFNNLLTVIGGFSENILLNPERDVRAQAQEIRRASDRAAELTRQLLAFSRQQILSPRVVDLGETVIGLERMLVRIIGEDVELHRRGAECRSRSRRPGPDRTGNLESGS